MSADRVAYWLARIEPATEPEDWAPEDHRVCGLNADRLYGGRDLTHPERAKLRPLVGLSWTPGSGVDEGPTCAGGLGCGSRGESAPTIFSSKGA